MNTLNLQLLYYLGNLHVLLIYAQQLDVNLISLRVRDFELSYLLLRYGLKSVFLESALIMISYMSGLNV